MKYSQKQARLQGSINQLCADLGIEVEKVTDTAGKSGKVPPGQIGNNGNGSGGNGNDGGSIANGNGTGVEKFIFYYHPDHLGSSSYISDANGEVPQHLEYFAFGEIEVL